jgi:hypothetical protein
MRHTLKLGTTRTGIGYRRSDKRFADGKILDSYLRKGQYMKILLGGGETHIAPVLKTKGWREQKRVGEAKGSLDKGVDAKEVE